MSPRRGPGEGHIKRITLRSGRTAWRGWLTVGYRENGTPIRRTLQRRTRDQVRDGLALMREKYRADLDLRAEAEMRLGALFDRWVAHYTATQQPKARTLDTYQWAIGRVKAYLGDPLVARVTPAQLQEMLNTLGGTLTPKSLNLLRVVCAGAFRQALLWRVRTDNPAADLTLPKARGVPAARRILAGDELTRFLGGLREERLGLAVALTYALAMRPSEAAALRWGHDVDTEAWRIIISGGHNISRAQGGIVREEPKSARGRRTLTIPEELRPWFFEHQARQRNERMAMGGAWVAPDEGLLFVRETDGGRIGSSEVYDAAERVSARLGLGKVGPRILRRSMLSALAASGVETKVRAAIGGHTPAVTEQHYYEVSPAQVEDAMGQLARILGPLGATASDEKGEA